MAWSPPLERRVAKVLEFRGNLEAHRRAEFLALVVIGEILVRVTGSVRGLFIRIVVGLARKLTTVDDGHIRGRLVGLRRHILDLAHHTLPVDHLSKNHVLAVEVGGRNGGDEELAAIRPRARIGHRQQKRAIMLEIEVLVGEFLAVNRLAAGSVEGREITTLDHELLNDPMEDRP